MGANENELSWAQMQAARAYALWHLGDATWADAIVDAALDPEATWEELEDAGMEMAKRHAARKAGAS